MQTKEIYSSMEKKLDILKQIDQGLYFSAIAVQFSVGKSPISDIKRGREVIKLSMNAVILVL